MTASDQFRRLHSCPPTHTLHGVPPSLAQLPGQRKRWGEPSMCRHGASSQLWGDWASAWGRGNKGCLPHTPVPICRRTGELQKHRGDWFPSLGYHSSGTWHWLNKGTRIIVVCIDWAPTMHLGLNYPLSVFCRTPLVRSVCEAAASSEPGSTIIVARLAQADFTYLCLCSWLCQLPAQEWGHTSDSTTVLQMRTPRFTDVVLFPLDGWAN